MSTITTFLQEISYDAKLSKKVLDRLPEEHFNWKPHDKSFSLGQLAGHLAQMYSWLPLMVHTKELDFSLPENSKPAPLMSKAEILSALEKNVKDGLDALSGSSEEHLGEAWTLRNGNHVFFTMPRSVSIRSMVLNHIIHHRGQLTVYYRLLGVPVPALYGPTADEM